MILHIDTDRMEALGLTDREMWLYLTLTILSARQPWKGTDEELAAKCKNNMSRVTIMRLKKSLIEKGLITENEDGLSPVQNKHQSVQNEQISVQNEHDSVQNEQNSKEKEKNQKKLENVKNKESDNNTSPAPAKIYKKEDFIAPIWNEWWAFAQEKQMGLFEAQKSFSYYAMRGWKDISNWKAALLYWDLKNKT